MKIFTLPLGPMQTNCYIVVSGDNAFAVDPADRADSIMEFLKKHGLTLDAILLTHTHFDHMGAVDELSEKTGAPLFCPLKDKDGLCEPKRNASFYFGDTMHIKTSPTRLLSQGDEIALGAERLTVLETPGHTAGSVCFLAPNILISGDTLFSGGYGRTDLPSGDSGALFASLHRILALEDRTVYPGHGPSTTILKEKHFYGI